IALSLDILSRHAVPPERVIGHSDVAPARKTDPGELFPWRKLALAGVGLWPENRQGRLDIPFTDGLRAFGYGLAPDMDVKDAIVIEAFQRHWRPGRIDGLADAECEAILAALLREVDFTK